MVRDILQITHCEVVDKDHPFFERERRIFNGYINRRPRAILYPENAAALLSATRLALEQNLPFSIRAGGHNVAGNSLIDDGFVIDTSRLANVQVDRCGSIADVQPGALWRDFDSIVAKFRLCTPGGIISDTGVAGLTLGGGIGWLNGIYGLSCDNLVEADVLLSSGDEVTTSQSDNFDLLWALRGGGGNFGLVTRFRFRLHALPSLLAGSIVYRHTYLEEAITRYAECCESAQDALTISLVASSGPSEPSVSLDICFAGVNEEGLALSDSMLPSSRSALLKDTRQPYSYVNWQRQFDDDRRRGRRSYWRAIYIANLLAPRFIEVIDHYLNAAPSDHSMLTIDHIHGASHRADSKTSAFGDRKNKYLFLINTNWDDEKDDEVNLNWCNSLFDELRELSLNSTYVNYLSEEGEQRIQSAFGTNLSRLRALKKRYDPDNHFCFNQNILPE